MDPHAVDSESSSAEEPTQWDGPTQSLKFIIIGARIAGLSAAVGLRRAGHDVEVIALSVPMLESLSLTPVGSRYLSSLLSQMRLVQRSISVQTLLGSSLAGDLIRFKHG